MRTKRPGPNPVKRPGPAQAASRRETEAGLENGSLREQLDAAVAGQAALTAVLGEAIEALEHSDATLTFLQQSLGVRASPRLEQLRETKAKLRAVLKERKGGHRLPVTENGAGEIDAN